MKIDKLALSIVKTILQWGIIILCGMLIILIVSTVSAFAVAIGLAKWFSYIIIILILCVFIKHIQYNYEQ